MSFGSPPTKPWIRELVLPLRSSAVPYLATLVVSAVAARWFQYLTDGTPWVKAQPAFVVITYAGVLLAALLGALLRRPSESNPFARGLLGLLAIAWVVQMAITLRHGDAFYLTAWLYLPVLALLAWRPPQASELIAGLRLLGWALAGVILVTLLLETAGAIDPLYMDPQLIAYEAQNYWLPVSDLFDIQGRWPGPFGHSGDTGAVSALVIVLGVAFRGRLFGIVVAIGVLGLLLTSVRVAMVAVVMGLGLLMLFSRGGFVARIPLWARLGAAALGVLSVVGAMLSQSSSLTGRTTIWPAFIGLWLSAPLFGVGATGINASGGITALSGHAHNLYLDSLVRTGVVGFVTQAAALGFGVWLSLRAMIRGVPGPMAVIATFLVIGLTQASNNWIDPGTPILMLTLCMLLAAHSQRPVPSSGVT